MNNLYIEFFGEDYKPLEKIVSGANVYEKGEKIKNEGECWSLQSGKITKDGMMSILNQYLEEVSQEEKLWIGEKRIGEKRKLVCNFGGKDRLEGVVGVVQGKINVKKSRYLEKDESQEDESEEDESEEDESEEDEIEIKFQSQSRIDKTSENKKGKPYFLATLILENRITLPDNDNMIPESEEEIFDYWLLFLFKVYFQEAYRLKGFYRKYRRFERNDDRLKGSIDIARHLRLNMGQNNGRIAYSYRENTTNNYFNHLLIATYEYLKKKYPELVQENIDNSDLKIILDMLKVQCDFYMEDVRTIIAKNLIPIAHPFYNDYEELRKICLKILRDETIDPFDGNEDSKINGFLFYLPSFWEQYLERILREYLKEISIEICAQKEIKIVKDKETTKGKTKPDYILQYEEEDNKDVKFMILDAKFKPGWEKIYNDKGEMDESMLDDYTKCVRDMVDINVYATGVIFPRNLKIEKGEKRKEEEKKVRSWGLSDYNKVSKFYTIPINVPYVPEKNSETTYMDYQKWKMEFQENLEEIMNELKKAVECEKKFHQEAKVKMSDLEESRRDCFEVCVN